MIDMFCVLTMANPLSIGLYYSCRVLKIFQKTDMLCGDLCSLFIFTCMSSRRVDAKMDHEISLHTGL
jgi:hypothetical protein